MARAHLTLTLLTVLTTAAGARYGGSDYVVHMPAYGDDDPPPDRDDYHAHSPDAPASPDYNIKYEEAVKDKEQSFGGEVDEANSWRRPIRKQRKRSDDDFRVDDLDKFEPDDDFPKTKSVNRFPKHRPRKKGRKFEDDVEEGPRFLKRPIRDKSDDVPVLGGAELQTGKDRFLDDSSSLEGAKFRFPFRSSSVRPRRRPRDRFEKPKSNEDDEPYPGLGQDRSFDIWPMDKERESLDRRLSDEEPLSKPRGMASLRPMTESGEEEEEPPLARPMKPDRNRFESNYDYYDMKRAMNIKSKLPAARRTQERHHLVPGPPPRLSTVQLAYRRLLKETTRRSTSTTTTTTPTTTTAPTIEAITKVVVTLTSTSPTVESSTTVVVNVSKELSIAEKSRLSILKKAQRKENGRGDQSTKKPPVLLQVTQKMQTVVMVEPPTTVKPWMRASLVAEDSPKRLKQVRRLMRQKLLKNARNIQDLTDNWDDVVCDYVDMSLLVNSAHVDTPQVYPLVLLFLCLLFSIS